MTTSAPRSVATVLDDDPDSRTVAFGSNSVQHGSAVFEGIRCHRTADGSAVFRLDDHLRRLLASARAMGIRHEYDLGRLREVVLRAAESGGLRDAYLRPVLYTPDPRLGVGLTAFRFTLGVEVWPATDVVDPVEPVRLTVSPWHRPGPSVFPVGVKATGLYALSALARTAALANGFDDAVQLDPATGRVAEATIANIFLVRDGVVTTPWRTESLLPGITRDSVLALASRLGYRTVEGPVDRAALQAADEVFLTGTAFGLVPVAAVDDRTFDQHRPIFTALRQSYRDAVSGLSSTPPGWLTPVPQRAETGVRT
ncbi:aminotransferase class IV [Actinophytocola xanthii]|uniref:Branched chain amino acid aminotransferase n=1 Tax=Actinophytocola xanthii TaxID=1912961 RepID=A0A1Q8CK19_9PSEU|nr:aminotransferase class IV [Actinophytocola xanthii]OLF14715.1 branched chain amino acid aminotransferase [Actinophytocola xanthii]